MHTVGHIHNLFPVTTPNIDQLAKDKMMWFIAFCTLRHKVKFAISILRCVQL